MSDDLKERMAEWWEYDHGRLIDQARSRIEELEAKLARAIRALEFIGCEENAEGKLARTALAELKGEKDE
jgi:hypothetical protein